MPMDVVSALHRRYPERARPVGFYPLPHERIPAGEFTDRYRPWETARGRTRLVYVHVPFCAQRCGFCRFYPGHYVEAMATDFVDLALRQLAQWQAVTGSDPQAGPVEAVFVGGGSPSVLTAGQLTRLLTGMREILPFVSRHETTVEWYPRDADPEKLSAAREAGCTRVSLGIQTWDAAAGEAMGAHHDAGQADAAVAAVRAAGIDNVNIDLMANTPGQHLDTHLADVRRAVAEGASMVSLNALEVAHGTPLAARATKTGFSEDDATKRHWLDTARGMLLAEGFQHQRVRNLCRPGGLHRYNRASVGVGFDILPVGPGAYGFVGGWAVMNALTLADWSAAVRAGQSAVVGAAEPTADEVRRAFGVSSFLELQLDTDTYRGQFGTDPRDDFGFLGELEELGALRSLGGLLRLTDEAAMFGDDVCTEFYSARQHELFARHLSVGRSKEASQYFPVTVASRRG